MIIPRSRPHRNKELLYAVLDRYDLDPMLANLIYVRGHYLDSLGVAGRNDINIYDDSCYLVSPDGIDSWNANTDPSFISKNGKDLAVLNLGHYQFYRNKHRVGRPNAYDALRSYPEGVKLPCTRNGKPSFCQFINGHKGGMSPSSFGVTHSEGCLTIPKTQYPDWKARVWAAMDKFPQYVGNKTINGKETKLIDAILLENKLHNGNQFWTDANGRII